MRRARIIYICAIALGSALGVVFAGCVKARKQAAHKAVQAADAAGNGVQTWHVSPNRVVVMFGYGYNDVSFVEQTTERLYAKYGAAQDGGLIVSVVFPDDFKKGKEAVTSELPRYAMSEDYIPPYAAYGEGLSALSTAAEETVGINLRGVLLLGAGENTNYAIARLQDYYGGGRAFPVFSLFPQDDTLGTEATSDFVLERVQETNVNGREEGEEENAQKFVPEVERMIERSIECFCELIDICCSPCNGQDEGADAGATDAGGAGGADAAAKSAGAAGGAGASLAWDDSLILNVMDIAYPLPVSRYVDGETGLQSVNHFVIIEEPRESETAAAGTVADGSPRTEGLLTNHGSPRTEGLPLDTAARGTLANN